MMQWHMLLVLQAPDEKQRLDTNLSLLHLQNAHLSSNSPESGYCFVWPGQKLDNKTFK